MPLQQTEKQLQHACISLLQMHENAGRLLFIRNNSFAGKIIRKNKKNGTVSTGYIKNNKPGAPDLIIFFHDNKTVQVELKSLTGTMSLEQKEWRTKTNQLNHLYYEIRTLEQMQELIIRYNA